MPHPAIPVGLSFAPKPTPRYRSPLLIVILPFVIISFLTLLPHFLAFLSSSLPAIYYHHFIHDCYTIHTQLVKGGTLLLFVRYTRWDMAHDFCFPLLLLLSSPVSFSPSLRISLAQFNTVCIFSLPIYSLSPFPSLDFFFFFLEPSIRRVHCIFLPKFVTILPHKMYNIKDEGFLTSFMEQPDRDPPVSPTSHS